MLALTREGQHSRRVQPSAVAGCDQRGILTLSARVCRCLLAELFFLSGVHHLYECMAVIRVERCCTSSSHAPALRTTGYLVIGSGGALLKSKDQEGRPGGSRDGADHVSYPRSLSLAPLSRSLKRSCGQSGTACPKGSLCDKEALWAKSPLSR